MSESTSSSYNYGTFFMCWTCLLFYFACKLWLPITFLLSVLVSLVYPNLGTMGFIGILVEGNYMQLLGSDRIQIYQTCNGMRSQKAAWLWRFAWATHWYGSFILPHFAVKLLESSRKKWIFPSFINQSNLSCIWMAIFPSWSSEGNMFCDCFTLVLEK